MWDLDKYVFHCLASCFHSCVCPFFTTEIGTNSLLSVEFLHAESVVFTKYIINIVRLQAQACDLVLFYFLVHVAKEKLWKFIWTQDLQQLHRTSNADSWTPECCLLLLHEGVQTRMLHVFECCFQKALSRKHAHEVLMDLLWL